LPTLLAAALLTTFSRRYPNWYEIFRYQRVQRKASEASRTAVTNRWRWLKQLRYRVSGPLVYLIKILWLLNSFVLLLFILIWGIAERYVVSSVLQGLWQIYFLSWVCVSLALLAFVYIYRVIYPSKIGNISKQVLSMGIFVIALLPTVAAVSAATLLPTVTLCGPSFHEHENQKDASGKAHRIAVNWIQGDLIGSNSESVFIAQWKRNSAGELTSIHRIEVVPKSMVKAEIIGSTASDSCVEVAEPKPTPTPSKPRTR